MADATCDWKVNNRTATYLTDFPDRVRRGWYKSTDPETILTCEKQSGVYICVNGGVNCRIVGNRGIYEWRFTIVTKGDKLWNVALLSDDFRANFILKSVQVNGKEIGVTNGQEWHDISMNDLDAYKEARYLLTIGFNAVKYGTYRQNIIFGFRRCPVFLQRICADYLPLSDYMRIQRATDYQLSQIPSRWTNAYKFYSPFMSHVDPRETKLSRIYPYPDTQNFFLSQDTLSDNQLIPRNYRGRMHEMITLEEIARHEQLSRYNQISWLHLNTHYILANSDGSTVAKYTPPGELFGQVRFFLTLKRRFFVVAFHSSNNSLYPRALLLPFYHSCAFLVQSLLLPSFLRVHVLYFFVYFARNFRSIVRLFSLSLSFTSSLLRSTKESVVFLSPACSQRVKFVASQLPICRDILEDTQSGRLLQRSCNSVQLKLRTGRKGFQHEVFEAHIEDKCSKFIFVRLSKDCVSIWNLEEHNDIQVEVQFVLSRLNFCEWHLAVDNLENMNLVFLKDEHRRIDNQIIHNFLHIDDKYLNILSSLLLNSLFNQEQKQAATAMALNISSSPPVLLLGPFGTGKTFTIAHVLRMLVQDPANQILLCTHSNSAADLYIKDFFHGWYKMDISPRLRPVRIYYKLRALNTVHPIVQEYCLMDEHGRFRDPEKRDLENCGLIVTTLATSNCLVKLNLSPSHIVIDEAAQAIECEALIALTLANRNTRLILAGDQMQLAPEIYSVLASERGLGVSLLERLCRVYPLEHPCRIHLCQNYRAHADIIKYTSEVFYNGMVKPANTRLMRHPTMKPLTFYAVHGVEEVGISTGYYHIAEAEELANRVMELRKAWPTQEWGPYNEGSIGVLSYYPEQVLRLRIELRKRHLSDVSVERVLNVQGKQFTAVFISTVRTRISDRSSAETKIKDYGFLTDPRLLNTALTRAKCLVAVVGDPVALLTIGSCKELWGKYLEEADLYGMNRKQLHEHLNLVPRLRIWPLNPHAQVFVPREPPMNFVQYVQMPIYYTVMYPPLPPRPLPW